MMEEVVVTGYGTFKKSAYAGSAASVKNEKIADVPSVSFQDLLQEMLRVYSLLLLPASRVLQLL